MHTELIQRFLSQAKLSSVEAHYSMYGIRPKLNSSFDWLNSAIGLASWAHSKLKEENKAPGWRKQPLSVRDPLRKHLETAKRQYLNCVVTLRAPSIVKFWYLQQLSLLTETQ